MSIAETLEVRFDGDSSGLQQSAKDAGKSIFGLKQIAQKLGLDKALNVRAANKELEMLQAQLSLDAEKMQFLKNRAKQLQDILANPTKIDTTAQQSQLDNLLSKMENFDQQIRSKQKEIGSLQANKENRASLGFAVPKGTDGKIAKLEADILRLMDASDRASTKVQSLDNVIANAGSKNPGMEKAEADLRKVNQAMLQVEKRSNSTQGKMQKLTEKVEGAGKAAGRTAVGLKNVGTAAKEAGKKSISPFATLGKVISQALKRILLMAVAYKAVRAAASYLYGALKANRQFTDSLNAIRVNLATAFQPIYQAILPAINTLMSALATLSGFMASIFSALFGKTFAQSKSAAAALEANKKSMAGYGSAAEKAKGQLAGFDQFNDITPQKDSGGGGGGGGGAPALDFGAVEPPKIEWLDDFLALLEPSRAALGRLWEQLKIVGGFGWAGLKDFYETFLKPVGKWVFGEGIPRFIDAITEGLGKVDWGKINDSLHVLWVALEPFAITIGEGLLWFWENVLVPLGTWVLSEALPNFLEAVAAVIDGLDAKLNAVGGAFKDLYNDGLKPLASWIGGKRLDFLDWVQANGDLVAGALIAITAAIVAFNVVMAIYNVVTGIAAVVTSAFSTAMAILTSPITLIILAVAALIAAIVFLVLNWDWVKEKAGEVWEAIVGFFSGLGDWFKTKVVDPITKFFTDLWDGVKKSARGAWDGIVGVFVGAWNWFDSKVLSPVKDGWEKIWNGIEKMVANVWDGITGNIKNAINGIIGFINGMISAVANGINTVINAMNKIKFDIPSWVPPPLGGKTLGFTIPTVSAPQIPMLAKGGIAYGEVQAIVGDNFNAKQNPEVIAPLSDLQNIITAAVLQRDIAGGGNEISLRLIMEDGSPLVEALIDPMNRTAKNLGFAPVFRAAPV